MENERFEKVWLVSPPQEKLLWVIDKVNKTPEQQPGVFTFDFESVYAPNFIPL